MIESHEISLFMCEYYSILYMFRIEPSTAVQGAYDVCNKDAVQHDLETVISRLYSDHRTGYTVV
jgi:hypothetical protein